MSAGITLEQLAEQTRDLQHLFRRFEERPWGIDALAIELVAEVGTLADSIMVEEGFRKGRPGRDPVDLADDISDVLLVLLTIANHYGVAVGKSYLSMINATREKLENAAEANCTASEAPVR